MKTFFQIVVIGLLMIGCKDKTVVSKTPESTSASLEIVNKRMAYYNQHNFEEFIKLYSKDVKVYTYPNTLLGTGTENISSIFKPKFASKSIQVEIINQIDNGSHVINHEIVSEGNTQTKYVSIYEVQDGLITSVRFVRDN
ncbi:MAG: nuclear transport factor 2 family protein [Bacteroidia bacterium]